MTENYVIYAIWRWFFSCCVLIRYSRPISALTRDILDLDSITVKLEERNKNQPQPRHDIKHIQTVGKKFLKIIVSINIYPQRSCRKARNKSNSPRLYNFCVRQFMYLSLSWLYSLIFFFFLNTPSCLGYFTFQYIKRESKLARMRKKRDTYMNCHAQK